MHLPRIFIAFCLPTSIAFAQKIVNPKPGSALRTAVLNGLRGTVEKTIGAPVVFKPFTFNVNGNWAFVIAQPVQKNGNAFDYSKTKLRTEYAQNREVWSDQFEGLLRKTSKGWSLVHVRHDFGDFDGNDLAKKYGLPIALFETPGN